MSLLDESGEGANGIVKLACVLLIGTILLMGLLSGSNVSSTGSVALTFSQNPHDGDTVQLDNNVYEFDNNSAVAAGHIPVTISTLLAGTVQNFQNVTSAKYSVQ